MRVIQRSQATDGCANHVDRAARAQVPLHLLVLALLLLIVGPMTILHTPTDIFPNIDIPVLSVIWSYKACPPTKWKSASY
ncbi:MAG: CzcABC family efflux RND transporter, transmembrane protein [uncultured Paraburkholderia sp.]|nr:MAG: CzcABC family efflux RND transporter, transmembrane protein [uncultured Paraburkholderia sp.]CAH2909559.1 MAG: CzcABC family efflux RND transporter, transmembrane protein [uncultured Paraburkholderia sp.]